MSLVSSFSLDVRENLWANRKRKLNGKSLRVLGCSTCGGTDVWKSNESSDCMVSELATDRPSAVVRLSLCPSARFVVGLAEGLRLWSDTAEGSPPVEDSCD